MRAASEAERLWIRLVPDMAAGTYEVMAAAIPLPGPSWPDLPMRDILAIAFKGRLINSLDHPVLRRLRGED